MDDFLPLFRSAHLQTVVSHFWPRRLDTARFPVERRLYRTEPDVQVLVEEQRPAPSRGDLVLVHGLEGSGAAGYMRSMAAAALEAGYAAHRFHMRTCGGTEALAQTLYHSGQTCDLLSVVRQIGRPVFLVGFSLGGNVVLKLAGELGEQARGVIRGVCAVSASIDLAACARRITHFENRAYELRFLRRMQARLIATGRYTPADFGGVRNIIDFDDRITARAFGFGNAWNYYQTQSAAAYLERIRVPALLIQSKDDPIVPFDPFTSPAVRGNPCIRLIATEHGGHLGFLARRRPRLWLDRKVIEWVDGTNRHLPPS